jgi:Tol biopolymer transport system component
MKRFAPLVVLVAISACGPNEPGTAALPPVTLLSPDSANHQQARFSPDGQRVFWWEPSGLGKQLWTATSDLSNPATVPVHTLGTNPIIWSPDGSLIAVPSSDVGLLQAAVIPAAGGPPRQITSTSGIAIPIAWNHDGDRVAFIATSAGSGGGTFQTFVTSLAGGGVYPMIPGENHPYAGTWSPDGSRIAYSVGDGSHSTLWVADSAGKNPRQLTTDGFEVFGPNEQIWSPDGRWLAYESRRTGFSDIWIVPVDSGAPRQLTHDVRNDNWPIWSPDGKWIAFTSDRGKQSDLWIVPASGGTEIRVTDDDVFEEPLQWLANSRFAFLTGRGLSGIWAMNLPDSSEKRLTPDSIRAGSPSMSLDGKQLAFVIERPGGNDVAVMPVAGGTMRTLVQGGNNSGIRWSPDGTRIAFISDRGGSNDIWVADVAGGEPRQLENWPGAEMTPAWSGDGSMVYFASDRDARIADLWKVAPTGGDPVRVTNYGAVQGPLMRAGRPEVYADVVDASAKFTVVQVKPDGSVVPVGHHSNTFPYAMLPSGDSLIIGQAVTGAGIQFRLIAANGTGDGRTLLKPGESGQGLSADGAFLLYRIPTGASYDIAMLNISTGNSRRLTNTSAAEDFVEITPDGSTVVFERSRPVRRIAIADLSSVLAKAASTPH